MSSLIRSSSLMCGLFASIHRHKAMRDRTYSHSRLRIQSRNRSQQGSPSAFNAPNRSVGICFNHTSPSPQSSAFKLPQVTCLISTPASCPLSASFDHRQAAMGLPWRSPPAQCPRWCGCSTQWPGDRRDRPSSWNWPRSPGATHRRRSIGWRIRRGPDAGGSECQRAHRRTDWTSGRSCGGRATERPGLMALYIARRSLMFSTTSRKCAPTDGRWR